MAAAVEARAVIASQPPVRSLRESTRAAALRRARTCYDHLAGQAGVAIMAGLVAGGALARSDGRSGIERGRRDRLSAPVAEHPYAVTTQAGEVLGRLGIDLDALQARPRSSRPLLRFCADWSQQHHHLAGALGAAVLQRAESAGWVRRRSGVRAVEVTDPGRAALRDALGVDVRVAIAA